MCALEIGLGASLREWFHRHRLWLNKRFDLKIELLLKIFAKIHLNSAKDVFHSFVICGILRILSAKSLCKLGSPSPVVRLQAVKSSAQYQSIGGYPGHMRQSRPSVEEVP